MKNIVGVYRMDEYNKLREIIIGRRSIRRFKNENIQRETIERIIDAAQWAPSACNRQLWRFIAVTDSKIKEKLVSEAKASNFIKDAPVTIYVLYHKDFDSEKSADYQSAAAAIQNILLAAHSLGLGATWINTYGRKKKVKEILKIPDSFNIISAVIIGYPDENPSPPKRKNIREILSYNVFDFCNDYIYPFCCDPNDWTLRQIINYRNDTIRWTTPIRDFIPQNLKEEKTNETRVISSWIEPNSCVLDVLPFLGEYTILFLKKINFSRYSIFEFSENPIWFIEQRKEKEGIEQEIHYIKNADLKIPVKENTFDYVLCLHVLDKLPDSSKIQLLIEIRRVLKDTGQLILSFRNKFSIFYLYYIWLNLNKKIGTGGPYKPISFIEVKKLLRNSGFEIKDRVGFSLSPLSLGRENKIFSSFSRITMLRCER